MDYGNFPGQDQKITRKIRNKIEDMWPAIYNLMNAFFFGIIKFIKFLIAGLWPGK